MTGDATLRTTGTRALLLAVCLCVLTAPAIAAIAVPAGSSGPTAAVDSSEAISLAGSTTVELRPTTASVGEGGTRTLEVVVTNADDGVGAISGSIAVAESEYAEIVDAELRGDPGLGEPNISASGESVSFEGALMDTAQTGSVTVAEITVRGELEGTTDLALSIESLGDESGDPYEVGGTPDTALTIENTRNEVPLTITADADSAATGESVTYTVMRADSDARVAANVTVGNTTVSTGVDGEATVRIDESMVTDAGTIVATASKAPTSQERYANDSVTVTHDESTASGGTDGGGTATDTDRTATGTDTGGAIVRTEPDSIDLAPGETTTVDVVVTGVDGGVGAGNLTLTVADPSVAGITDATVVDDPGIGSAEVSDDSTHVTAEFALRDGGDAAPVRVVVVTLQGVAGGSTTLSVAADSLGDEQGNSYRIGATPDSAVRVQAGGETATDSATPTGATTVSQTTGQSTTTGGESTTATTAPPTSSGTEGQPVPTSPSTALLAFVVVVVILLGFGSLAS